MSSPGNLLGHPTYSPFQHLVKCLTYVYEHLVAENNQVIYIPVTTIK